MSWSWSIKPYPYTISNGAGEALTFLGVVRAPNGDRVEAEARAQPGAGPPMHVHRLQEEAMTVRAGRLGYQVQGEAPRYAESGETVIFPPGVAHKWWNAGATELHCTGWAKPPDNIEFFLTTLFDSMKRSRRKRPTFFDAAYLLTRYRSEIGMLEIPALVQRFLFPVIVAVGHLSGQYQRYRDAPPPVTRTFG